MVCRATGKYGRTSSTSSTFVSHMVEKWTCVDFDPDAQTVIGKLFSSLPNVDSLADGPYELHSKAKRA